MLVSLHRSHVSGCTRLYRSCKETGATLRLRKRGIAACGRRRVRSCRQTGILSVALFGINHWPSRCRYRLRQRSTGAATSPDKGIRYIGTDVVPRLIESAQALTMRDDWKFSVVDDVQNACTVNVAAFFTFFSFLPHTTHEESLT